MMMTSDIALKVDPEYRKVCEKFLGDFDAFTQAFSKAWYKLTHRDMGPREFRYLGPEKVTIEPDLLWQDPIPLPRSTTLIDEADIAALKTVDHGQWVFRPSDLVFTAFSAAATLSRSATNVAVPTAGVLRSAPQKDWVVNRSARYRWSRRCATSST